MVYSEVKDLEFKNTVIRTFSSDIVQEDLVWVVSDENIIIEPLHGNNWKIQFENMIPQNINEKVAIRKKENYKLIKGSGCLKIRIYKS